MHPLITLKEDIGEPVGRQIGVTRLRMNAHQTASLCSKNRFPLAANLAWGRILKIDPLFFNYEGKFSNMGQDNSYIFAKDSNKEELHRAKEK